MWHWLKSRFLFPLLFILVLLQIGKLIFLFANRQWIANEEISSILQVFTHSFSLDLSVAGYILLLIVLVDGILSPFKLNKKVIPIVYTFITSLFILFSFIDTRMYQYWQSKINMKALSFLNSPEQAVLNSGIESFGGLLLLIIVLPFILYPIFNKITAAKFEFSYLKRMPVQFFLVAFGILLLRGGFREIPINQSDAYFSKNNTLNIAGVNTFWNFGNALFQNYRSLQGNPYELLENELSQQILTDLYDVTKDSTTLLLEIENPNIVMITMEGVNANCLSIYNKEFNLMPKVSSLKDSSYILENMYATGMRTDQGIVAINSGFPALPLHTISSQPDKFTQLPSMSIALKEKGYSTQFYFGGEPEFGSIKAYLTYHQFDKIYSFNNFEKAERSIDLGVPDDILFNRALADIDEQQEPFFSMIMTQSTHEPFDMPFNKGLSDNNLKYQNTVSYLDSLIYHFYSQSQSKSWFENTLFIITSDHSHTFPGQFWYTDKKRFHIPFIITGNVLKNEYKGQSDTKNYSQTDIPKSLSKQLQLKEQNFSYSRDFMNPYSPNFSYFIYIHGQAFFDDTSFCAVNFDNPEEVKHISNQEDSCYLRCGSFIQSVFNQYMNY